MLRAVFQGVWGRTTRVFGRLCPDLISLGTRTRAPGAHLRLEHGGLARRAAQERLEPAHLAAWRGMCFFFFSAMVPGIHQWTYTSCFQVGVYYSSARVRGSEQAVWRVRWSGWTVVLTPLPAWTRAWRRKYRRPPASRTSISTWPLRSFRRFSSCAFSLSRSFFWCSRLSISPRIALLSAASLGGPRCSRKATQVPTTSKIYRCTQLVPSQSLKKVRPRSKPRSAVFRTRIEGALGPRGPRTT